MRLSPLISRYLISTILPYFIFAWLILSVILFVQQAGRFSDIFFSANIPANLVWQLTIALVPNVIAFTCPMAVLVGVMIGLSKMQGDNELAAIRASGVGNLQITVPIIILGIVLSGFAFIINLYGVPFAASIVRSVALQTAIYKLESPIEPGVFNTDISGYTVYVEDGDDESGQWKNIFVYNEAPEAGVERLITSTDGRIDSVDQFSELVLRDAVVTTITRNDRETKLASENIGEFRFAIKTRRGELIERLSFAEQQPEELGISELAEYARTKTGRERTEAEILRYRRIMLSVSPLVFCLLGSALILRFNRSGRGFGVFLSLVTLIGFYLAAFLGEQLARTEWVTPFLGSIFPLIASLFAVAWFNSAVNANFWGSAGETLKNTVAKFRERAEKPQRSNFYVDLTTGLRDFDTLLHLVKYYLYTVGFLGAVFLIFTAFELWKFAGTMEGGTVILAKYLFYLLPFIYIQLAPSAAMIATLATYVIKSRQNEIITWTSAGQSIYRLLVPCMAFMIFLGAVNWVAQEFVLPYTNIQQDRERSILRSRGEQKLVTNWVATPNRIYSFRFDNTSASDNEPGRFFNCRDVCAVEDLRIFEFDPIKRRLQHVYRSPRAVWAGDRVKFVDGLETSIVSEGNFRIIRTEDGELLEGKNPFGETRKKPSQLNTWETMDQIASSESKVERRNFRVALEKKYTTLFLPLVIALFTAPFAMTLGRKGNVVTVGYAVGLWLLFMGLTSAFEQFGLNGSLAPRIAVWAPLVLFTLIGIVLLSRVKT